MIIDTHLHEGAAASFTLPFPTLLQQMEENGIAKGLVSTVACCEYRPDADELLLEQTPQLEANRVLLDKVKASGGRLYQSFWCKPATEPDTAAVYTFLRKNRAWIRGLKIHPFYSRMPLEDARYVPYWELAAQLDLPVSVHTAADNLSNPEQLLALAKRYPQVRFMDALMYPDSTGAASVII